MQRRGNARTSHHRGQRLLHTLLITANLLGCHSTARGVAADSPPQSARAAPSFGLTLGSPLLPAVPPGSISATEAAEAAIGALPLAVKSAAFVGVAIAVSALSQADVRPFLYFQF